MTAKAVSKEKL